MKELLCKINPFMLKQQIFEVDLKTEESQLIDQCLFGDIEETLYTLAVKENVYNFHLCGDLKFLKIIGENLKSKYQLNHSNIIVNIYYN